MLQGHLRKSHAHHPDHMDQRSSDIVPARWLAIHAPMHKYEGRMGMGKRKEKNC